MQFLLGSNMTRLVIFFKLGQPASDMASSNSSFSISKTVLTPCSPLTASPKITGLPIWNKRLKNVMERTNRNSFTLVWVSMCLLEQLVPQLLLPWKHLFHNAHLRRVAVGLCPSQHGLSVGVTDKDFLAEETNSLIINNAIQLPPRELRTETVDGA